ncbi:MAG: SurA N-terminal domain-containing protein [Armatimonadetes bacterium]|nr:SurA N-terminal domain-containing protein [Armatimonadota bacterium]MCX7967859.1 SurA N-terminal domain-containing protein [Armatimonadota bacterium]MDW8142496.1 SurA N-terminal domain-containing protein [Armatimonadota bacterium]
MRFFRIFLPAILLVGLLGCGGRKPIAVIGGRVVTYNEFEEAMERYYGARTLRWLIQHQLLLLANEKQKLVSDKEVEREYKNFMRLNGFENEQQFLSFLARQGMTKEGLLDDIKHNLILLKLREKQTKVDDKTLEQFFKQNWVMFAQPPTGEPPTVRCFLFQSRDRKELEKVKALIQQGEDIRKVAYDFYKDNPQLRSTRGEVTITLPLLVDPHQPPPLPPSLLNLLAQGAPLNQLHGPVLIKEANFWVLVKVLERKRAFVLPFEEIKPQVKTAYVQFFGPPPELVFQQLAKEFAVSVHDPRFKFLEDEIRTRMMIERPSTFQPPAEAPSLTKPPSQEGGRLEQREQESQ